MPTSHELSIQDKNKLKSNLLEMNNNYLYLQAASFKSFIEGQLKQDKNLNDISIESLTNEFYTRALYDSKTNRYTIPDSPIISLIREEIENDINNNQIKTPEEGQKRIASFYSIAKQVLVNQEAGLILNQPEKIQTLLRSAIKNHTIKEAKIQEAKNMYKHIFNGVVSSSKWFLSARLYYNLHQQEKKMRALGMTENDIRELKKQLNSTAHSADTIKLKK